MAPPKTKKAKVATLPASAPPPGTGASFIAQDLQSGSHERAESALGDICKQLRGKGVPPLLDEYVQASPLCVELFSLWESLEASQKSRVVASVMEVLAAVLRGRFEATPRVVRTRISVAGRILSDHLPTMYRHFSSERDNLLKSCLKLVTGVSTLSLPLAAQLLRAFNFEHEGFTRLVERRSHSGHKGESAGREDVRTCFAQFALSFLRWRNANLTASAVRIKGLVGTIFRGLADDPPEEAITFMRETSTFVLQQRQVHRQTKLFLYNAFTVRHLCKLLAAENADVSKTALTVLVDLCTNPYLYRQAQYKSLLEMCVNLKPLHKAQQELITAVLRAHPTLQVDICGSLNFNLQPSMSLPWFENMHFLSQLLELPVSTDIAQLAPDADVDERIADFRSAQFTQVLLPKALQKALLTNGLMHSNPLVLLATLRSLLAALARVRRALDVGVSKNCDVVEMRQHLQRCLPEMNTLLLIWQKIIVDDEGMFATRHDHADEAPILATLGLAANGFHPYMVFSSWCEVIEAYVEVIPESMLDSKFDWSKLLAAVSLPYLSCKQGVCAPDGITRRLLSCLTCVDTVMRCSGRLEPVNMAKSELTWVELMLQVSISKIQEQSQQCGASISAKCASVLRGYFNHFGIFGTEESVEASSWLSELKKHPTCVPFFCDVLRVVTQKPALFTYQFTELLGPEFGNHTSRERPSLFLFAATKQLAYLARPRKGVEGRNPVQCGALLSGVVKQLASLLPQSIEQMVKVIDGVGPWPAVGDGEVPPEGIDPKMEDLRQKMLLDLHKWNEPWRQPPLRTDSSVRATKRRKKDCDDRPVGVDVLDGAIMQALDCLLDSGEIGRLSMSIKNQRANVTPAAALRQQVRATLPNAPAKGHCLAYVLLEAINLSITSDNSRHSTACGYFLSLIEVAPALAAESRQTLEFALNHAAWRAACEVDTSQCTSNLCSALAFEALCHLLTAMMGRELSIEWRPLLEKGRTLCNSVLLPLLFRTTFGPGLLREQDNLLGSSSTAEGDDSGVWTRSPATEAARRMVAVASRLGCLDDIMRSQVTSIESDMQRAIVSELLLVQAESQGSAVALAQLTLPMRTSLLRSLIGSVLQESESSMHSVFLHVLSSDWESVARVAWTAKVDVLWPKPCRKSPTLTKRVLPLLTYSCRVNPSFRQTVLRRLDLSKVDPSIVLLIAASLAPFERSLPFLDDDTVTTLDPQSLLPLPPCADLCQLVSLHPSKAFSRLLRKAIVAEGGDGTMHSRTLLLQVENARGQSKQLERALGEFLSHAADVEKERMAIEQEIELICKVLAQFKEHAPEVDEMLGQYTEALSSASPELASVLLGRLLDLAGKKSPATWQTRVALSLVSSRVRGDLPEWLLRHAVRWWHQLKSDATKAEFIGEVAGTYQATLSTTDIFRRQLLILEAAGELDLRSPWGFRHWCAKLSCWSQKTTWDWSLQTDRVRASTSVSQRKSGAPASGHPDALEPTEAYDMAYVVLFLVGQLRVHWALHTDLAASESKAASGPVITSVMTGGGLELLLLATSCRDGAVRCCAHEGLSIITALASLWDDAAQQAEAARTGRKARMPFRELPELVTLLQCFRNSLEPLDEGNPEAVHPIVPALVTSFLSASVPVLLDPQHILYRHVGKLLIGHTSLLLADIPLFYKLLLFGEAESHEARLWLFRVLRRGLRGGDTCSLVPDGLFSAANVDTSEMAAIEAASGSAVRVAMGRKFVMEWLLSFAGSSEMSNFAMWSEAMASLEAALADPSCTRHALKAFGICEWLYAQALRKWPVTSTHDMRRNALQVHTRVLGTVLGHASLVVRECGPVKACGVAELNTVGAVLDLVIEGWVEASKSSETDDGQDTPGLLVELWNLVRRYGELTRVVCEGLQQLPDTNPDMQCFASRLSAMLRNLLRFMDRCCQRDGAMFGESGRALLEKVVVESSEGNEPFWQVLRLLHVCPLSVVLHSLLHGLLNCPVASPIKKSCTASGDSHEEQMLIVAAQRILEALRGADKCCMSNAFTTSIGGVLRGLAAIPFSPGSAWRAHTLLSSALLILNPWVEVSDELLSRLPHPSLAVASPQSEACVEVQSCEVRSGLDEAAVVVETERLLAAADLLKCLLSAVG